MTKIKSLIKTDAEYELILAKIEHLMVSARSAADHDELELLSALAELYEQKRHPILPPDPIDAIKFRMEQMGLKQKDLVPLIGSRAKVSEILSGKRPLSLALIRELHDKLGVPAATLLREPTVPWTDKDIPDPHKFPWEEIVARNWLSPIFRGTLNQARTKSAELARYLLRNLNKHDVQIALFRRNVRAARIDRYALLAWTAQLINVAKETLIPAKYRANSINDEFMRKLVSFSYLDQGPQLAKQFLLRNGIVLVVERHLSRTHVDGAATILADGTPVVGLSLRHNRLDNFWFCLFHELAHIALHLHQQPHEWFVDDLDVTDTSSYEKGADQWAQEKLIPKEHWARIKSCSSPADVMLIAQELYISQAIIAGRLRYERKNYKLFSSLIGQGEVHRHFFPS